MAETVYCVYNHAAQNCGGLISSVVPPCLCLQIGKKKRRSGKPSQPTTTTKKSYSISQFVVTLRGFVITRSENLQSMQRITAKNSCSASSGEVYAQSNTVKTMAALRGSVTQRGPLLGSHSPASTLTVAPLLTCEHQIEQTHTHRVDLGPHLLFNINNLSLTHHLSAASLSWWEHCPSQNVKARCVTTAVITIKRVEPCQQHRATVKWLHADNMLYTQDDKMGNGSNIFLLLSNCFPPLWCCNLNEASMQMHDAEERLISHVTLCCFPTLPSFYFTPVLNTKCLFWSGAWRWISLWFSNWSFWHILRKKKKGFLVHKCVPRSQEQDSTMSASHGARIRTQTQTAGHIEWWKSWLLVCIWII